MSEAPWYAGLDQELHPFITARGYDKLDAQAALAAAIKGHHEANKMLSSAPRMPVGPDDPNFQTAYERIMGMAPAPAPDAYKFDGIKFKDGTDLDDSYAGFLREFGAKHKLSPATVRDLAAILTERADSEVAEVGNSATLARQANQLALRQQWGGATDERLFAATRAATALRIPEKVLNEMAAGDRQEYIGFMEGLAEASRDLNEMEIRRGGGSFNNSTSGLSPEQAEAEKERLFADPAWRAKFQAGDREALKTFSDLGTIIVRGAVNRTTRR